MIGASLGRNEACPCGSGKKYKQCCLRGGDSEFLRAAQRYAQGDPGVALKLARSGISRYPRNANLYLIAGLCLLALGSALDAEKSFRRALLHDENNADACSNLAVLLGRRGLLAEAEELYRKALKACPACSLALLNLGDLLADKGQTDEAEVLFAQAIELIPDLGAAHYSMGHLQASMGRREEAERSYRAALRLNPGDARATYNLACLLLSSGEFDEGWRLHEIRMSPAMPVRDTVAPPLPVPFWCGESLSGKRLLVWPEQGLGDELQFLRYLLEPQLRDCGHLTLVCKPPLKSLFSSLGLADAVFAIGDEEIFEGKFDYWTFPMSFPYRLKTGLDSIPVTIPYIAADRQKIDFWRERLPASLFRVGLVWKGNPDHRNDSRRSLGTLCELAPLWRVAGQVSFVSLQKGPGAEEARHPAAEQPLFHCGDLIEDFSDSAAIVHHLDLVICVDTAIAHLAGAMGKRCWVLLPAIETDWRWLHERQDSPWYPGRLRLFRQSPGGAWSQVVAQVCQELAQLLGDSSAA